MRPSILFLQYLLLKEAEKAISMNEVARLEILNDPNLKDTELYHKAYNWKPPRYWKPTYEEVEEFVHHYKKHHLDEVVHFTFNYTWVPPEAPTNIGPKWNQEIRDALNLVLDEIEKNDRS